ncbi:MAG: peroxiredoxin family protein [Candidatus Nitrospinota bacterium M3_3B_026]
MKKDIFGGRTFLVLAATFALGYMAASADIDKRGRAAEAGSSVGAALAAKEDVVAPDFTLPSISGGDISLSNLRGKWVFVNFWATWCGPCVVEMPMMNKLHKKLAGKPFEMVAISIDDLPAERVRQFVEEMGLDFTVLLDRDNKTSRMYGIVSIPQTYIIDPEGRIVSKANGMREWDSPEVVDYFKDLINGGSKPSGPAA